jgi:hypothetical protein
MPVPIELSLCEVVTGSQTDGTTFWEGLILAWNYNIWGSITSSVSKGKYLYYMVCGYWFLTHWSVVGKKPVSMLTNKTNTLLHYTIYGKSLLQYSDCFPSLQPTWPLLAPSINRAWAYHSSLSQDTQQTLAVVTAYRQKWLWAQQTLAVVAAYRQKWLWPQQRQWTWQPLWHGKSKSSGRFSRSNKDFHAVSAWK